MVSRVVSHRRRFMAWLAGGVWAGALSRSYAATPGTRAGQVDFVRGPSFVLDGSARQALRKGASVGTGQTLETGEDAEIHVLWDDGGYLAVRPQSRVRIDAARMDGGVDDSLWMTLLSGALRSITGWVGKFDKRSYSLSAGTTTIGIRGTDHEVALLDSDDAEQGLSAGVHHWVNEGATTMHTEAGNLDVERGNAAWARNDGSLPRAHPPGLVQRLLRRWKLRHEAQVDAHSQTIRQHIERRLRLKKLLARGETLEQAQQRHQALLERWREKRESSGGLAPGEGAQPTEHKARRHWWRAPGRGE